GGLQDQQVLGTHPAAALGAFAGPPEGACLTYPATLRAGHDRPGASCVSAASAEAAGGFGGPVSEDDARAAGPSPFAAIAHTLSTWIPGYFLLACRLPDPGRRGHLAQAAEGGGENVCAMAPQTCFQSTCRPFGNSGPGRRARGHGLGGRLPDLDRRAAAQSRRHRERT